MSDLRFDHVTVRLGTGRHARTVIDDVDLTVPDGQVLGLVGESGSGKSTLARTAVGLIPVAAGRVLLAGEPVRRRRGRPHPVQMVFQDPQGSLDPRSRIGDTIAEGLPRVIRRDRSRRHEEVVRLLDLVDLDAGHADVLPAALSGGQRQRAALARALAVRSTTLITDEMTSALDVSVQGAVLNVLRDLQRRLRMTVLFISHDLAVVRHVADQVAVMHRGRIVETGPTDQVLTDPQDVYTRELLASVPE